MHPGVLGPEISEQGQVLAPETCWRDHPRPCRGRAAQSVIPSEFGLGPDGANKKSHSAHVSNVRHLSKTRVEALDKPAGWHLLHFPATCIHSPTSSTGGTRRSRLARRLHHV